MTRLKIPATTTAVFLFIALTTQGTEKETSLNEWIATSDAICRGSALNSIPFEKDPHNRIFTATGFSVTEIFKGAFAETVEVEHRGGELNGRGEYHCNRPTFQSGEDYLLFIVRREDGSLFCSHHLPASDPALKELQRQTSALAGTGSDLSDRQASLIASLNLLPGSTGYSSRFLQADRGEPIEYVVDMDTWPAGITSNQALTAVSNAFAAWSSATTLAFTFGGVESFGMAAPDLNNNDERIYIQLHDNYNYIAASSTLARGGRSYSFNSGSWPDGGLGARVGTNEFDRTNEGFVVVEHTKSAFSTLSSLEEVLCHEVGHVLSLGHSSEDGSETNSTLSNATMYYLAHLDGRGAVLQEWDTNTIHIVHPLADTPPYGYDRIIRAITSPNPQASLASGVNQVDLPSYDLQGGAVPLLVSSTSNNGTFSLEGATILFFTSAGWYGDSSETGPGSFYDRAYIRMSDGVNLSPPILVRVIQFLSDGNNDQLPNSWVATHGISGGASGDYDSDGFTNLEEWFLDSDPNDALNSLLTGISSTSISWNSRINDLYQIQSTTNLLDGFSDEGNPSLADSTNETLTVEFGDQKFYRIQRLK